MLVSPDFSCRLKWAFPIIVRKLTTFSSDSTLVQKQYLKHHVLLCLLPIEMYL